MNYSLHAKHRSAGWLQFPFWIISRIQAQQVFVGFLAGGWAGVALAVKMTEGGIVVGAYGVAIGGCYGGGPAEVSGPNDALVIWGIP